MSGLGAPGLPWILCLTLYLYAFVSLVWTPDPRGALQQWSEQVPYVALVALASPFLLRSGDDMRHVCDWVVVAGGALCALALFLGHWGSRGLLLYGNALDLETNPLAIASLAGTVTVVATLSIQRGRWWKKVIFAAVVPIALATIIRSGSRGQFVATVAALLVGWPLSSSKRNLGAWFTLAAAVGVLYIVGSWVWQHVDLSVVASRWSGAQSTEDVQGRLTMATTLLRKATSDAGSLIFGLGNSSAFYYIGFYPHITPAEILAEEGVIGITIYLWLLIATGLSVWRLRTGVSSVESSRHAYGVLTALFVFELILTFKEGSLLSSTYVFAYAAILGRMVQWDCSILDTSRDTAELEPIEAHALPFPNLLR
jgi:hypothetical protein